MSHYYTNDEIESRPSMIHFDFQGHSIDFHSDRGVFSKDSVDFGSRTLLDTVNLEGVKSVLDVGCGYGALSISLKMVYPDVTFDMVDVNRRAMILQSIQLKIIILKICMFMKVMHMISRRHLI